MGKVHQEAPLALDLGGTFDTLCSLPNNPNSQGSAAQLVYLFDGPLGLGIQTNTFEESNVRVFAYQPVTFHLGQCTIEPEHAQNPETTHKQAQPVTVNSTTSY